ncbi:MAG: PcfJ domain-containing protein [Oscillospiraceae bacterium]|nr:PcfJ domain-containing protein [Oscillospiraceae bacterium]
MVLQPMPDGGIVVSAAFCARDYTKDYHNVQTKYDPQYIMYFNEGQAITFRKSYVYNYGYQWIPMASIPEPGNPQNFWGSVTYKTYCMDCTPETLQNTFFRYCPISNSMKIKKPQLMGKFFALYAKHPVLVERLIKQGFIKVVEEKISRYKNGASPVVDWKKTTVAEALNLDKSGVRAYAKKSLREMAAYQLAYKFGILNPADIEWINEKMTTHDSPKDLSLLLKYASVTKLRQYTNKITKTKKGYASFGDYVDYIRQCQQLKLDLKQKSILYPQDFVQAHAQNTAMLAEIKAEKEMKAAAEIDAAFAVKCKRLAKKYEYTDGTLLIRPAAGKRELFVEGKTLGHCVYTDYADSYIKGELIILFIRKVSNPNIPYYTLELSKEGKIRQCRGKGNCAMTAGVKAFADKWQEELEAPKTKQNKKVASAPAV